MTLIREIEKAVNGTLKAKSELMVLMHIFCHVIPLFFETQFLSF